MTSTPIKLKIPAQDLAAPTRFSANVADVSNWLQSLPDASLAGELSSALAELNSCAISPQVRYDILEVLRPQVENANAQLARHYLNQSPLVSTDVLGHAEQADQLCTLLGTAYTIVGVEVCTQGGAGKTAKLACEAIHRALMCCGRAVLQTMQLYRPLHMDGWMNLHQLYALAQQQKIAELPVPDPLDAGPTITAAYLQAILLGCCQPNRSRQSDLAVLYKALGDWSQHVALHPTPSDGSLFVVDIDSDQPPLYRHLVPEETTGRRLYLDTAQLLLDLRELHERALRTGATFESGSRLPVNILEQVVAALSTKRSRTFKRMLSRKTLAISPGMKNCHYYVASGLIFEQVLYGAIFEASRLIKEERFTPPLPNTDIWHEANPHEDFIHSTMNQAQEWVQLDEASRARLFRDEIDDGLADGVSHYPVYQVPLADVSPGGYCLDLDPAFPGVLRTGELVCLQEDNNSAWQIAVIRWLHMPSESRLLAGLELLSPRARAFGACIHDKSGKKTPPMRALLLPEIKIIGQAATLVTPRAGFREG
ncbi:MAG: hypothetical protein HKN19_00260, partial [Halioglobus sp.]|nr:hypothetical protein [Halioglobus sp.]